MANRIKQGDAYSLPVLLNLNDAPVDIADVDIIEFYIGGFRKLYPGDVTYDSTDGAFYVPITQEESLSWQEGENIVLDARVKFVGGNVQGIEKQIQIGVVDAVSEEVL